MVDVFLMGDPFKILNSVIVTVTIDVIDFKIFRFFRNPCLGDQSMNQV